MKNAQCCRQVVMQNVYVLFNVDGPCRRFVVHFLKPFQSYNIVSRGAIHCLCMCCLYFICH